MPTLEIRGLSKTYPDGVTALSGVSLTVPEGVYGLLGPNGAGKSTLMRTIATLQRPDAGTVLFDGVDIVAQPDHVRRRLGYLPQEFGVYPNISTEALLRHLAVLKGVAPVSERRRQVEALLDLTNLRAQRRRPVSALSGGMRQRFGIAQALLGDPRLVVVDEPTSGLDPAERNRFHDLLGEIGESVVVILSTHIVEDVRTLCSRMAVLDEGSVRVEGHPRRLLERLEGKVWERTVDRDELGPLAEELDVISRRLIAGRVQLRAWSDRRPGPAFRAVDADLEDLYFATLGHFPAWGREARP